MRRFTHNFLLRTLAVLLGLFFLNCSSRDQKDSEPVLLGSFEITYDALTENVTVQPIETSRSGLKAGQAVSGGNHSLLDWDDSIKDNLGLVTISNCAPSNWNGATKVVSHNFKINNVSASTILSPIEFRVTGMYFIDAPPLVTEINTNLDGQGCLPNPITLSNCDSNSNGQFDTMWPDDDSTTVGNYADDPGWNFSTLLNGDTQLGVSESSECAFMQFKLNRAGSFGFYTDVFGRLAGTIPAPSVSVNPTGSPVNDSSPLFTVTLNSPANQVRISGGSSEVTCADDTDGVVNTCDLNASAGTVVVDYSLKTNESNTVSVFQGDGVDESPATVLVIVHDNQNPEVVSILPPNNSINFSPNGNVLITFDGDLLASTVSTSTFLLYRDGGVQNCSSFTGGAIGRAVSQPSASEVSIDPSGTLLQNTIYCVVVCGVSDISGTPCGGNYVQDAATNSYSATTLSQFKTSGSDSTAPYVTAVYPQDGASSVSLNTSIQVTFNEAVLASTITSASFTLTTATGGCTSPVAGTRSVSADGKTITLTPTANLCQSASYTITVTTTVTDLATNTLAANFTSSFTSGAATDTTQPTIVAFYPPDQATNVNENILPQITFSEPMLPSSINTTNIHLENDGTNEPIAASVSLSSDGLTATLTPIDPLDLGAQYLVSVEYLCQDLALNYLLNPQTSQFTVQSSPDATGPNVTAITPADNSADVSIYTAVVVAFDEQIDPNTVHTGTILLENTSTTPATGVSGSVTVAQDGLSATFTQLSAPLTKNKPYRVTVKSGSLGCTTCVKDLAGNPLGYPSSSADVTSSFNTEFKDEELPPRVIGVAPGNTATGIPINAKVILTFSEAVQASSITDNSVYVTIPPSTTHVTGTLRLMSDGINVRFTPSSDLTGNTTYQVNVTNGVKDLTGNGATTFTSTFMTTNAAPPNDVDSTGPVLDSASSYSPPYSSAVPITIPSGTTNVPRWRSIYLTFNEEIDPSTVNILNNVQLIRNIDSSKVPVRLSMSADAKSIIVNPVSLLANLETYTINLKTGLQNISGLPLQSFTTFQFTTESNASSPALYVSNVSPANGSTNQPTNTLVTITLSEEVDPDTIVNGNVSVTPQGGGAPPKGDLTISLDSTRKIITVSPQTVYQNNTTYTVRLKTKLVDDGNNGLSCSTSTVGSCDSPSNPTDWISTFRT
ncbi:MAG TPA: Ig-like domain-containing protein [Bdellovibrionota bacterium]|nr:Ig-like domain-containing protein [Bdellovibrionota bacterium]